MVAALVPAITLGQYVTYAAAHVDAPGHGVAHQIVAVWRPRSSIPALPPTSPRVQPTPKIDPSLDGPGSSAAALTPQRGATSQPSRPGTDPGPAPRPIGPVVATSAMEFADIRHIRPLPDGRVLVNDGLRHLVWMVDAALRTATVVVDSAPGHVNSYGREAGGLLPWVADSSLFVDPQSKALVVLDPRGRVGRVMAAPTSSGMSLTLLAEPAVSGGQSFLSPRFGLVYETSGAYRPDPPPGARDSMKIVVEDSIELLGMSPTTRSVEDLLWLARGATREWTIMRGRATIGQLLPTPQ